MTKENKMKLLVMAALLTIGAGAQAQSYGMGNFIPLEQLNPQLRAYYMEQLEVMAQTSPIDWSAVTPGINQQGQLVLIPNDQTKLILVARPTCPGPF